MKENISPSLASGIFGCFRCGETMGPMVIRKDGYVQCGGCGEVAVLTFQQALDTLNDLWLRGDIKHFTDYSTEESLEDVINE